MKVLNPVLSANEQIHQRFDQADDSVTESSILPRLLTMKKLMTPWPLLWNI